MITSLTEDEKVDNFLDDGNALVLTMNLESRSDGDIRIHLGASRRSEIEEVMCNGCNESLRHQ